jgi:hypothetical protein
MTGQPYALWAHVRFRGADGRTTAWSEPFGFNLRWRDADCGAAEPRACDVPRQLPAPAGLIRWSPTEGATSYDVVFTDLTPTKTFSTTTNVADQREIYTFRAASAAGPVHWRVRAVRAVDASSALANRLPRVSYGPWSPVLTTTNPPATTGALRVSATVSDTLDAAGGPVVPHELMPGFAWNGSQIPGADLGSPLYRVYVFTDRDCVNRVFTGPVVGSPAYAPRTFGGPFTLPSSFTDVATWQGGKISAGGTSEGPVFDADGEPVKTNELPGATLGEGAAPTGAAATSSGAQPGKSLAGVDLWDSGWPTGRFYWTVVPVAAVLQYKGGASSPPAIEYHDGEQPQDACSRGRVMSFGKISAPVVAQAAAPYATGMSPDGRMVAAASVTPRFHDSPLVAWEPVPGAQSYEVQWSQRSYPWVAKGTQLTVGTAFTLPLRTPGTWYYRVRGINPSLPAGAQKMTWSKPAAVRISGTVLKVVSR